MYHSLKMAAEIVSVAVSLALVTTWPLVDPTGGPALAPPEALAPPPEVTDAQLPAADALKVQPKAVGQPDAIGAPR